MLQPWVAGLFVAGVCLASAAIPGILAVRLDNANRRLRQALFTTSRQLHASQAEVNRWRELYPDEQEMNLHERKTVVWRPPPQH